MKEHIRALRAYFKEQDGLDNEIWGEAGEDYNFGINVEKALNLLEREIDWIEEEQ